MEILIVMWVGISAAIYSELPKTYSAWYTAAASAAVGAASVMGGIFLFMIIILSILLEL